MAKPARFTARTNFKTSENQRAKVAVLAEIDQTTEAAVIRKAISLYLASRLGAQEHNAAYLS